MVEAGLLEQAYASSVEERQAIIDAIAASIYEDEHPLDPATATLIDERVRDAAENPDDHKPWARVKARLWAEYGL
jgi:hypothetical protein